MQLFLFPKQKIKLLILYLNNKYTLQRIFSFEDIQPYRIF